MVEEPKCQRCEHRYGAHRPGCQHEKIGAFDPETRLWGKRTRCTCEAYIGVDPKSALECPHEFLPNSSLCTACAKTIKRRVPWPHRP